MIRDVAMHQPCSWIVSFKGDYHVSISGKQDDIASRRVFQLQAQFVWKRRVFDLLKDGKVMAMQVDLIRSQHKPGLLLAKIKA
jgi:hypothetical protein